MFFCFVLFFLDGHQRELSDHVRYHVQSLTQTTPGHPHQDRLEQDPQLQDWQRDAECLEDKVCWGYDKLNWGEVDADRANMCDAT